MSRFGLAGALAVVTAAFVYVIVRVDGTGSKAVPVRGASAEAPLAVKIADFDPAEIVAVLSPDAISAIDRP